MGVRTTLAEWLALGAVWVLVGVPAGSAVVDLAALAVAVPFHRAPTLTLAIGGVLTAALDLSGRRPSVGRALAFAAVVLLLGVPQTALIMLGGDSPVVDALASGVAVLVAAWVVFAGGYRRLATVGRSVLRRLARMPPQHDR